MQVVAVVPVGIRTKRRPEGAAGGAIGFLHRLARRSAPVFGNDDAFAIRQDDGRNVDRIAAPMLADLCALHIVARAAGIAGRNPKPDDVLAAEGGFQALADPGLEGTRRLAVDDGGLAERHTVDRGDADRIRNTASPHARGDRRQRFTLDRRIAADRPLLARDRSLAGQDADSGHGFDLFRRLQVRGPATRLAGPGFGARHRDKRQTCRGRREGRLSRRGRLSRS